METGDVMLGNEVACIEPRSVGLNTMGGPRELNTVSGAGSCVLEQATASPIGATGAPQATS